MIAPLSGMFGGDTRVLIGAEDGDDAGVYLHGDEALIATVDFITPVCDDPRRFGRVAAANSISDVYAMGGRPLFALNICCFPKAVPREMLSAILEGAAEALVEAGAVPIGGHTVKDEDLKFGLAVIGRGDKGRLLTHAGARPGDRLLLTKPLGTGVLINAFRKDKLDADGLEPALCEMERLNTVAAELALQHGVRAGTDVTGFGLWPAMRWPSPGRRLSRCASTTRRSRITRRSSRSSIAVSPPPRPSRTCKTSRGSTRNSARSARRSAI